MQKLSVCHSSWLQKNGHSISLRLEKRKGRKDAPVSLLAVPYSICSHKILLPPTPPLASLDRGVDRTYDRFLTQKKLPSERDLRQGVFLAPNSGRDESHSYSSLLIVGSAFSLAGAGR